jgi:hypothetical protein
LGQERHGHEKNDQEKNFLHLALLFSFIYRDLYLRANYFLKIS